jgi:hypothetical protein
VRLRDLRALLVEEKWAETVRKGVYRICIWDVGDASWINAGEHDTVGPKIDRNYSPFLKYDGIYLLLTRVGILQNTS